MKNQEALAIVTKAAPELTQPESLLLRAVALHETGYGGSWKPPGNTSHNWGANGTLSTDPTKFFAYTDRRNDNGTIVEYEAHFATYPDDESAVKDLVKVLLKSNVRAAIPRGLQEISRTMHANRYFLGFHRRDVPAEDAKNVEEYRAALERAVTSIVASTGEPVPFPLARAGEVPAAGHSSSAGPSSSPAGSSSVPSGTGRAGARGAELGALWLGSRGLAVLALRYVIGSGNHAEQLFDDGLEREVREFQKSASLVVDGVVGPATWRALLGVIA